MLAGIQQDAGHPAALPRVPLPPGRRDGRPRGGRREGPDQTQGDKQKLFGKVKIV